MENGANNTGRLRTIIAGLALVATIIGAAVTAAHRSGRAAALSAENRTRIIAIEKKIDETRTLGSSAVEQLERMESKIDEAFDRKD